MRGRGRCKGVLECRQEDAENELGGQANLEGLREGSGRPSSAGKADRVPGTLKRRPKSR